MKVEQGVEDWDALVDSCQGATAYQARHFLDSLGVPWQTYAVVKAGRILAAISVAVADGHILRLPYQQYNGLFLASEVDSPQQRHDVTTLLAGHLVKTFRGGSLWNYPEVLDMRAFQWASRPGRSEHAGRVDVAYTAMLRLDAADLINNYQTMRRRSVEKAWRAGLRTESAEGTNDILLLQNDAFERQGLVVEARHVKILSTIVDSSIVAGRGRLFVTRNCEGTALGAAFFLVDRRRAYYVAGGSSATGRALNAGSLVIHDAILAIQAEGLKLIDFVGANSPQRGAFKLSFGSRLVPYFGFQF